MDRVPVRELSRNTSAVLARVQRGDSLEVTVSGAPVARLVPIEPSRNLLDRLVAEGRAVPPTVTGPVPMPPVLGDTEVDAASVLPDMRDEKRR